MNNVKALDSATSTVKVLHENNVGRRFAMALATSLVLLGSLALLPLTARADIFAGITGGAGTTVNGSTDHGATFKNYRAEQFLFTGTRANGTTYSARGYCIDIHNGLQTQLVYSDGPPTLGPITWILNNIPSSPTNEQAGAIQAAIWHWSDGFELAVNSPTVAGYDYYLSLVSSSMGKSFPVPKLALSETNAPSPGPATVTATVTQGKTATPFAEGTVVTFTVGAGGSFSATRTVTTTTVATVGGKAIVNVYNASAGTVVVTASVAAASGLELLPPTGIVSQHLVLASPITETKSISVVFAVAPTPRPTPTPTPTGGVNGVTATPTPSLSPAVPVSSGVLGITTPDTGAGTSSRTGLGFLLILAGAGLFATLRRQRSS